MVAPQKPARSVLSDDELMAAIRHDLRAIYSDVIREPLPGDLAAALYRLELRSCISAAPHTRRIKGDP